MPGRIYDRFITGLAAIGALSLLLITCTIVVDVVLRNTGHKPLQSTSALAEYTLMFSTMCAAPWLVRQKGHVAISAFTERMPTSLRRIIGLLMNAFALLTLGLLAWRAGLLALEKAQAGTTDMRSISIPSWVLLSMLSAGLFLSALEFLRLLWRGKPYDGSAGAS